MQVYQQYKNMLYNASFRIVKNQHDAQDAVHDAFIKAFQNISKLERDLNLGAWLKRIVVNCSLDFLRKKKKLGWLQDVTEFLEEEADTNAYEDISFQIEEVKKAINGLKDKYRIIIVLYLIEEYSHKEIAEQLNIQVNTSKSQLSKAKATLRKMLEKIMVN